jgi:PKD repeat protein
LNACESYDPEGLMLLYEFDIGDGNGFQYSGNCRQLEIFYEGTTHICVRVTDNVGLQDTACYDLVVLPPVNYPPVAQLSATPLSGQSPLLVSFDASDSMDPNNDAMTYQFDFGDGTSQADGSSPYTTHTYTTTLGQEQFTATVTVTDEHGAQGTAQVVITVSYAPPPGMDAFYAIERITSPNHYKVGNQNFNTLGGPYGTEAFDMSAAIGDTRGNGYKIHNIGNRVAIKGYNITGGVLFDQTLSYDAYFATSAMIVGHGTNIIYVLASSIIDKYDTIFGINDRTGEIMWHKVATEHFGTLDALEFSYVGWFVKNNLYVTARARLSDNIAIAPYDMTIIVVCNSIGQIVTNIDPQWMYPNPNFSYAPGGLIVRAVDNNGNIYANSYIGNRWISGSNPNAVYCYSPTGIRKWFFDYATLHGQNGGGSFIYWWFDYEQRGCNVANPSIQITSDEDVIVNSIR